MATLSQTAPGLHVSAPDEDMEISSPYRRADNDFDIDLDLGGVPLHDQDDDYMLDDVRSEASHQQNQYTSKDDVMLDDDGELIDDGVMHDDVVRDEDLGDAGEMGFDEHAPTVSVQEPTITEDVDLIEQHSELVDTVFDGDAEHALHDSPIPNDVHGSSYQEEPVRNVDITEVDGDNDNSPQEEHAPLSLDHAQDVPSPNGDHKGLHPAVTEGTSEQPGAANGPADPQQRDSSPTVAQSVKPSTADYAVGEDKSSSNLEVNREMEEHASTETRMNMPTSTYHESAAANHYTNTSILHPVMVVYEGNEMSLFPPSEQNASETFLLQDHALAYGSISDLLSACRRLLGDTLSEEEELEIGVAELGLLINEDSIHASSTSLSSILDVYVQLRRNDGTEDPYPLYITLTTRTGFSSRLTALHQAIAEGKGLSQISLLTEQFDDDSFSAAGEDYYNEGQDLESGNSEVDVFEHVDNTSKQTPQERMATVSPHHSPTPDRNIGNGYQDREDDAKGAPPKEKESQPRFDAQDDHHHTNNKTADEIAKEADKASDSKILETGAQDEHVEDHAASASVALEQEQLHEDDLIDYDDDDAAEDNGLESGSTESHTVQGDDESDQAGPSNEVNVAPGDLNRQVVDDESSYVNVENEDIKSAAEEPDRNLPEHGEPDVDYDKDLGVAATEAESAALADDGPSELENEAVHSPDPEPRGSLSQTVDSNVAPEQSSEPAHEAQPEDHDQLTHLEGPDTSTESIYEAGGAPEFDDILDVGAENDEDWDGPHNQDAQDYLESAEDPQTYPQQYTDSYLQFSAEAEYDADQTQDADEVDGIDYDDDELDAPQDDPAPAKGSPSGKRTWSEHNEGDEDDGSDHELKRLRSG